MASYQPLNLIWGPQGSILGPLLVYTNMLPIASSMLLAILFADDSNAFTSYKSLDTLFYIVNCELS